MASLAAFLRRMGAAKLTVLQLRINAWQEWDTGLDTPQQLTVLIAGRSLVSACRWKAPARSRVRAEWHLALCEENGQRQRTSPMQEMTSAL